MQVIIKPVGCAGIGLRHLLAKNLTDLSCFQPFTSPCHLNRMNPKRQSVRDANPPASAPASAVELNKTGQQLNATNADFLRIDAETAITFSQMALGADNPEKRERNHHNARKAYDTIMRLRQKVDFTPAQEEYINQKMEQLKRDLTELGEKF